MSLDEKILIEKYHQFNKEYFNNEIKGYIVINFHDMLFQNMLGCVNRTKTVSIWYKEIKIINIILLNNILRNIDISNDAMDTILVHEMIHLHLMDYKRKIKTHGHIFRSECRRIKKINPKLGLTYRDSTTIRKKLLPNYPYMEEVK